MTKKIVSILLSLFLFNLVSCQSFYAGSPPFSSQKANEFETPSDEEGDPVGQWIVIGIVGAIAVGSAVMVPLYMNDKL